MFRERSTTTLVHTRYTAPEIRHRVANNCPEIEWGEIHIPDDSDLGTGTFTTTFVRNALPPDQVIASVMIKVPDFQITATLNPNLNVPVAIGRADGHPKHRVTYRLPTYIKRSKAHTLVVEFAGWHVLNASLDGAPLSEAKGTQPH